MRKHSVKVCKARGVKIVSGDTDNHLMLVDLSGTETKRKRAGEAS